MFFGEKAAAARDRRRREWEKKEEDPRGLQAQPPPPPLLLSRWRRTTTNPDLGPENRIISKQLAEVSFKICFSLWRSFAGGVHFGFAFFG